MPVEFKTLVFTIIGSIPKGKVATYGQIAAMAGMPNYARKVGFTLKSLPSNTKLPWYRVINSQGKISFPTDSDKYLEQKKRLENEGVAFLKNRIKLEDFQWSD